MIAAGFSRTKAWAKSVPKCLETASRASDRTGLRCLSSLQCDPLSGTSPDYSFAYSGARTPRYSVCGVFQLKS